MRSMTWSGRGGDSSLAPSGERRSAGTVTGRVRRSRRHSQLAFGLSDKRSVHVIVDHRERASEVHRRLLEDLDAEVRVGRLDVGDYVVDGTVRVERKTFDDFQVSIVDGRLFHQANRLCRGPGQGAFILEGSRSHRRVGLGREQLQGALLVLGLVFGLPVFRSRGPGETVWLLKAISRQSRRRLAKGLASRQCNPRDPDARRIHMLASCPGVGPDRAHRLLTHFGSLARVFAASESELLMVPGLGVKTARRLRAFIAQEPRRGTR
jgi:DNA excision repair protein ERCC-4